MGKRRSTRYDPDKTWAEQQRKELSWQTKACQLVRDAGGYAEKIEFKMKGGCPDTIAVIPYRIPLLIEFKMGVMRVDPMQKSTFKKMELAGFHIVCIAIYRENDIIWFIQFDYNNNQEIKRCLLKNFVQLLWPDPNLPNTMVSSDGNKF